MENPNEKIKDIPSFEKPDFTSSPEKQGDPITQPETLENQEPALVDDVQEIANPDLLEAFDKEEDNKPSIKDVFNLKDPSSIEAARNKLKE
ncbi:MAG: hypothetical protein PHO23_01845 [Candidatus Pacebacteria bacterium]|nr:hypothetical protein [Candidatus Paceibacterota bacterium]